MKAKDIKYIVVFGGTGFIGRCFVWKALNLGYKVVLITRKLDFNEVLQPFIDNWGNEAKKTITKCAVENSLKTIYSIDYSDVRNAEILVQELNANHNIKPEQIIGIVNTAGATSGSKRALSLNHLGMALFLKEFITCIGDLGEGNLKLIHLSSVAAFYNLPLKPNYEKIKAASDKIINSIQCSKSLVYIAYAKGLGEKKMAAVAPRLAEYTDLRPVYELFISIVDVERLALHMLWLINVNSPSNKVEALNYDNVMISSGSIKLGELVYTMTNKKIKEGVVEYKLTVFDTISVLLRMLAIDLIHRKDSFYTRVACFMKLGILCQLPIFKQKLNNLNFFGKFELLTSSDKVGVGSHKLDRIYGETIPSFYTPSDGNLYINDRFTREQLIQVIAKSQK